MRRTARVPQSGPVFHITVTSITQGFNPGLVGFLSHVTSAARYFMSEAVITEKANSAAASGPLSAEQLAKMIAYWRTANYLSVGQIYLKDNPLLERPLTLDDVKPRLLGHWGTTPGLNLD